jgi:hypothetical protein
MNDDFKKQLEAGEHAEDSFIRLLRRVSPLPLDVSPVHGNVKGYDVVCQIGNRDIKFEVKYDKGSNETGNIVIEWSKVVEGCTYDTGLLVTTADWWVQKAYRIGRGYVYYVIRTNDLKNILLWKTPGGWRPSNYAERNGVFKFRTTKDETVSKGNPLTNIMVMSLDRVTESIAKKQRLWTLLDDVPDKGWLDLLK